nr:hypothetical protein [uncultured Anaerotignum sp.]
MLVKAAVSCSATIPSNPRRAEIVCPKSWCQKEGTDAGSGAFQ